MDKLWLHRAMSRISRLSYRGKVLSCVALASAPPVLASLDAPAGARTALLGASLGGAALGLMLVAHLLRPVMLAARTLRAAVEAQGPNDLPTGHPDEAAHLVADAARLEGQMAAVRHRLEARHPVSGLPTREPFLTVMAVDIEGGAEAGVLGIVRFADFDRLAAFDVQAADAALTAFAQRLTAAVGVNRPLAQVDRDAFAVWFGGVAGATAAPELRAIGHVVRQDLGEGDRKITPDVGLGAAIFPHDGSDPATLLIRAFAAVPKAAQAGAAKLSFFSAESSSAARARFALEQDLRQAIGRDQFLLHYQPVVDLDQGRVTGAEALIRWRHPERGLVSPAEFVPVLEETGLMDEVGLWVLNTACREARVWEDRGLAGLRMAVNLSARQFRDRALNTTIVGTLERHGLAPEQLELELTETATMEDAERTRQLFGELRTLGVGVAIDDFGTGYSSLSYLKNLPFSKLKIDREFVDKVHERRDSQAICKALIELAHGLGITVMAEGVETREEVETLRRLGCSTFQGFYFARPLAAGDFIDRVNDPEWLALLGSPVHRERAQLASRVAG